MTELADLVALSLLPSRMWRLAADALRQQHTPARVLHDLVTARWPDAAPRLSTLRADAAAAIERARAGAITAIAWSDPEYPAALTTIPDPSPVLWTRGCRGALSGLSVAIVGSRAATPYAVSVAARLAGAVPFGMGDENPSMFGDPR